MSTIDRHIQEGQLIIVVDEIMKPEDQVLGGDEWLQLRRTPDGYTYMHELRCNGQIVAILVVRHDDAELPILGRFERCPSHHDGFALCAVTGGMEKEQLPSDTALMEIAEETGYNVDKDSLIDLGSVRPSKGADTTAHLFAVDVTGLDRGEIEGDGSSGEDGAYVEWISVKDAIQCKDPLLATMIARYYGIDKKV